MNLFPHFSGMGPLVVYLLLTTHLTVNAVTLYLHRSMAHGGVTFHPFIAFLMRVWLWLTTGMVTREWVAVHRKHHSFAEREGDPHSPRHEGILKVLFLGVFLYRKAVREPGVLEKYGQGTPDDWFERNIFSRLSILGPLTLAGINQLLFPGWPGAIAWVIQMTWIPFWAAGVINGLGHFIGYRNHDTVDDSHNISPVGIIMGGEELHNNHHYDPKSPKLKYHWWEFDIGWVYIRILKALGLAKIRYAGRDGQVLSRKARKIWKEMQERAESVADSVTPALDSLQSYVVGPTDTYESQ